MTNLGAVPHQGGSPYLSDLVHQWLVEKVGNHTLHFTPNTHLGCYSVRIDGILIGWVFDDTCEVELASGDAVQGSREVRRRRDTYVAADPLLFEKWWERIMLIDKDCKKSCGYSIAEYK